MRFSRFIETKISVTLNISGLRFCKNIGERKFVIKVIWQIYQSRNIRLTH